MKEGTAARRSLPFDAVSGMLPSAHAKRAGRAGLDLTPVSAKQTGIEFTVLLQPDDDVVQHRPHRAAVGVAEHEAAVVCDPSVEMAALAHQVQNGPERGGASPEVVVMQP